MTLIRLDDLTLDGDLTVTGNIVGAVAMTAGGLHVTETTDPTLILTTLATIEHKWVSGIIQSLKTSNDGGAGAGIHYRLQRSRAGGAVVDGDEIFLFAAEPHNGSDYFHTAGMRYEISGAVAAGNCPTRIVFETTTTNAAVDRWAIESAGHLVPITTASYDLGTTSKRVNGMYGALIDLSQSSNGVVNVATLTNSSTGNAAVTRLRLQTGPSGNDFTIDAYGENHATLPNYARIINQVAGPLEFGADGAATVRIAVGGGLQFVVTTPPSSLANGQMWWDGTDFKVRHGGATKTVTVA